MRDFGYGVPLSLGPNAQMSKPWFATCCHQMVALYACLHFCLRARCSDSGDILIQNRKYSSKESGGASFFESSLGSPPNRICNSVLLQHTLQVMAAQTRTGFVERDTKETSIQVSLSLDGGRLDLLPYNEKFDALPGQGTMHHASQDSPSQQIWVWTGIGFLDHMIHAMGKHAGWSLRVRTLGDLASKSRIRLAVQQRP